MRNPLIWLSGADPRILQHASTDRAKYLGIGGAVLTTATLASISMFFALRMAVGAAIWATIPLCLVWFLVILNLDRWLVVSLQRSESKLHTLLLALPRVFMAVLFGVIISTPLVLQVFDREVQVAVKELQGDESRAFQQELVDGPDGRRIRELERQEGVLLAQRNGNGLVNPEDDAEIKALRAKLPALEREARDNDDKAACELTGDRCKGTSGRSGDGPRYQKYAKRRDDARRQISQINRDIKTKADALRSAATENKDVLKTQAEQKLPGVQSELRTLRGRQHDQRAAFEGKNADNAGLLIRLKGLDRASEGESQLWWARFLLFLFITVLECLPIIVKVLHLFGPPGPYDEALERHRSKDRMLLADHLRKQQGVGLRENSEHVEYAQLLERRRAQMREELVERTIEAETRVHQAELDRWEREQMSQVPPGDHQGDGRGLPSGGPGGGPWQGERWSRDQRPSSRRPAWEPVQARILREQPGAEPGTTRDDLRLSTRQQPRGWLTRLFRGRDR